MLHLLPSSGVYIYLKIKCCLLEFGGCSVVYKVQNFDSCFIYQLEDREQTKENGREKKREEKEQKKRNKRKGKRKREKERKRKKKKKMKKLRVEKKLKKGIERNITWNRIGQLYLYPES